MKKGSKKSLLVVVLLLLVGVTAYFAANTYAKYASHITGNEATATVAKWAFGTENATKTFTIALEGTVDTTTLVAGRIAPGTQGHFEVALTNKDTETGVDFTVKLNSITGKPTNLKFYRNSDFTGELTPGTTEITGQIKAEDATGVTIPIYWKWAYETAEIATNDPIDTANGETPATLTVGLDIVGVQTQPGAAITTHVNNN